MGRIRCIEKIRKGAAVTVYVLQDETGAVRCVGKDLLKEAMKLGNIKVENLQLGVDGRLVDKAVNNKQYKAEQQCKAREVARGLVYVVKVLSDIYYDFSDICLNACSDAGINYDIESNTNEDKLDRLLFRAFTKLVLNKPGAVEGYVGRWLEDEYIEAAESVLEDEARDGVKTLDKSKVYKSFVTLLNSGVISDRGTKDRVEMLLKRLRSHNMTALYTGVALGNTYYKYLDSNVFGTISNDVGTVGYMITSSDVEDSKLLSKYEYVMHLDFNTTDKPNCVIAIMIDEEHVDIRIGYRYDNIVRYRYSEPVHQMQYKKYRDNNSLSKSLGTICNRIGKQLKIKNYLVKP